MSAASIATSVPAPMAMPMSARVSAGGVVDAVSHHGDRALLLQTTYRVFLAVRQYAGYHLVDAGLSADGPRGAFVVAREHHHADAHVFQLADRLRAVLFDGVGNGDDAGDRSVHAEEERCLALLREPL